MVNEIFERRLHEFRAFVIERHSIFMRRHGLSMDMAWTLEQLTKLIDERFLLERSTAAPYTEDPILQNFRFCNVYRELDRVTSWIRKEWRVPYPNHKNLWFAMAVARQINHTDTLGEIGFPNKRWDVDRAARLMQARRDRGQKVYTSAYMLTGTLGGTKIDQTTRKILAPLFDKPPAFVRQEGEPPSHLESVHKQFVGRPGFKGFMAYEVVSDLRWTRYLENAPDINNWAFAGPGAQRGLARLSGRRVRIKGVQSTEKVSVRTAIEHMQLIHEFMSVSRPKWMPSFEMREIEHSLCEWDKYERAREGTGRPKSLFKLGRPAVSA